MFYFVKRVIKAYLAREVLFLDCMVLIQYDDATGIVNATIRGVNQTWSGRASQQGWSNLQDWLWRYMELGVSEAYVFASEQQFLEVEDCRHREYYSYGDEDSFQC